MHTRGIGKRRRQAQVNTAYISLSLSFSTLGDERREDRVYVVKVILEVSFNGNHRRQSIGVYLDRFTYRHAAFPKTLLTSPAAVDICYLYFFNDLCMRLVESYCFFRSTCTLVLNISMSDPLQRIARPPFYMHRSRSLSNSIIR